MRNITLILMLCIITVGGVYAQVDSNTFPISMDSLVQDEIPETFNIITLEEAEIPNLPENSFELINAVPVPIGIDFNSEATEVELPYALGSIKRLGIQSTGASSLVLVFSEFWLPEGTELHVYDESGTAVRGAYTKWNNRDDGTFTVQFIPGDLIIIEYYVPPFVQETPALFLDRVYHDFLDWTGFPGEGESEDCNIGVRCSQSNDWLDEIRSVVKIKNGSKSCSGVLVNNTNEDRKTYILSALHCFDDDDDGVLSPDEISNTRTTGAFFNWESYDCSTGDDVYDNFNNSNYTLSGATVLVWDTDHDIALLEFDEQVPNSFAPYYAGWNSTDLLPKSTLAGIHHPAGDEKKISIEQDAPLDYFYYWNVTYDQGNAEPGTSGSPLFEHYGYTVGIASNGSGFDCATPSRINYGKLSGVWSSATNGSGLSDFLDASGTGDMVFRGLDPLCGTRTIENTNFNGGPALVEEGHQFLTVGDNVICNPGSQVNFTASYGVTLTTGTTFSPGSGASVFLSNTDCASHPIVNIFGPSTVCRTANATYTARVLYGTAPFTYEWFRNDKSKQTTSGVMSRTNTFVYTAGLFHIEREIECRVTDANGLKTTHKPMWVDPVTCLTTVPDENMVAALTPEKEVAEKDFVEIEEIEEIEKESAFKLYPNPGSSFINIAFTKQYGGIAEIKITNISGEIIEKTMISEVGKSVVKNIPLKNYIPGMYFAQISVNGKLVGTKKFIVIH